MSASFFDATPGGLVQTAGTVDGKADRIARHLIYRLATGQLAAGDRLPSLRAAQRAWAVSQSTIVRAYETLVAAGYVESRARDGYYVLAGRAVDRVARGHEDLRRLYGSIADLIRSDSQLTVVGALRYLLELAEGRAREEPECVFVECTAHQAQDLAAQVRRRLNLACGAGIVGQLADDAGGLPASARVVLTTRFHEADVEAALRGTDLRSCAVQVGYAVDLPAGAPRPRRIVVVATDGDQARAIAADLAGQASGEQRGAQWLGAACPATLPDLVALHEDPERDVLVLSPTVWENASPELTERETVHPLRTVISASEWHNVADVVGVPLPPATAPQGSHTR